ncbi:acyltransferase family protein [Acidithiobacillus sp. IBUN Pt1247-S3]|uniref:acyltransferase family protein n=1 Tax=Acidithiobacillus sp. IBUN Pt1247-S3 TaxID=3166642 RepID=UPI0034E3B13E
MFLYLDYLKFLAIFAVIAFHIHDTISFDSPWFSGGYLGVDVFLFLSGFLIERSLEKAVESDWASQAKTFLTRRFSRILIPMLVVTLLVALFCQFTGVQPDPWQPAFWSAILGYNFYLVFHHIPYFQIYSTPHPFLGMWFIALLGQLYIAHFLLRSLLGGGWLWRALLLILIGASFAVAVYWLQSGQLNAAYVLPSHGFPYWTGALLAALGWGRRREALGQPWADALALAATAAMVLLCVFAPWEGFAWYSGAVTILTAVAVGSAAKGRWLPQWRVPVLGKLGEMSYSLYLWNVPAIAFVHFYYHDAPIPSQLLLGVMLVLLLAVISYVAMEIPIQRAFGRALRHDFPPAAYALVLLLLALGSWGWWEANRVGLAWSTAHSRNQHDALYQQFLEAQIKRLSKDLKTLAHTSSLGVAERRAGDMTAAETAESSSSGLLQWQPHPGFGFLYNDKEIRQNLAYPHKKVLFITDSILLGWSGYVIHMVPNAILNGQVGRSFFRAQPVLQQMLADPGDGQIQYIVVELGSNGYVPWNDLEQFIQDVGPRKILLVIPAVPRPWENEVREMYLRAAAKYSNVRLLHWDDISKGHAGYFVADQVHLNWDGAQALMQAILRELYVMGYRQPGPGESGISPATPPASPAVAEASSVLVVAPARSGHAAAAVGTAPSASAASAAVSSGARPAKPQITASATSGPAGNAATRGFAANGVASIPLTTESVKPMRIVPLAAPTVSHPGSRSGGPEDD